MVVALLDRGGVRNLLAQAATGQVECGLATLAAQRVGVGHARARLVAGLDGTVAERINGPVTEAKKVKPPRTHWDMLIERRSIADLEDVLAERLDVLRARRSNTKSA